MGTATPEVDVQDELSAALEASKDPGKVIDSGPSQEEVDSGKEEVKEEAKPEDKKEEVETKTPEAANKDDLLPLEEQNKELRQILRAQKREMSVLKSKLDRVEKRSVAATKKVEEESDESALFGKPADKVEKAAEPADDFSPIEVIQSELAAIARAKGPILDTLLEVMEASPKYADIREVCSQANFDDIFEAIGDAVAAKEGKDASIAALEAEAAVWKMPNPYKYMHGLIKQYHPKYASRQVPAKDDAKKPEEKAKEPVKVAPTLADKSGKTSPTNAWTSARIDEMDEMELNEVPPKIYEKYLAGELE